jgi:hypothetical protein
LQSLLRTFDFAAPDTSNPQRHQTTVPQQALFLLNSPFLKEQARHLAAHPELARIERIDQRVDAVHRRLFGRPAEPAEVELAMKFLGSKSEARTEPTDANATKYLTAWDEYLQTLLLSNEFVFVD